MPVLDAFVGVQEPALVDQTSKIDNVQVTTGEGAVKRQVTVQGDPEDPTARAKVANGTPAASAYGLVVRQVPENYDSGNIAAPTTLTVITATATDLEALMIANTGAAFLTLDLTDGNGLAYMTAFPVGPNSCQVIPFHGIRFAAGVKALASGAGLRLQLRGRQ